MNDREFKNPVTKRAAAGRGATLPPRGAALALRCAALALLALAGAPPPRPPPRLSPDELRKQVVARETAFAATMAARDFRAFAEFVAEDAVFLNGGKPLRGKPAVLDSWRPLFKEAKAPFSWRPELVEAVGAGDLAESTGPVFAADGKVIAHYYSTWRRDAHGVWHIELDNGYDECACAAPAAK
jgi:ketosteroid isomerase-like protein